ncbi:uncharacterized protein GBIM_07822 [Gryllus bimaculatus]|nr:uncharacterized protein GBIM_07822 [Gryllus bimaculatus]
MKPEDGPWISLPSKHYPEVYYFNVLTAESRWEKPPSFCEPVDDSENLQCIAKPTTPERKGNSYIVESLSPSTSPKKPPNESKSPSKVQLKGGREKRSKIILQRNRSQISELLSLSKKCIEVKQKLTKDVNEAKSKPEVDLKSDVRHSVSKISKSNDGEDIIQKAKSEERLQSSDKKSYDSSVASQKIPHSEQRTEKVASERTWGQHKRDFPKPTITRERSETMPRRGKVPDAPVVYGVASLRMELLKKQLREDRHKKCQRPQSDWAENSSEKEWQTGLLNRRNRLVEEIRHPEVPSYSSSSNMRPNYCSGLGNEPLRARLDSFPSRSYSQVPSGPLTNRYLPKEYIKPCLNRDYYYSKEYNDNFLHRQRYSEYIPSATPNDQLKTQTSLHAVKPYSKSALSGNYSLPNCDKTPFSNSCIRSGSPPMSTCNILQKYSFPDNEFKRTFSDTNKYYLSESEKKFFPNMEISVLPRTKPVNQLVKYSEVLPCEPYNKTGLVKDRISSLEHGRNFPSINVSKTPAMDRLRNYKPLEVNSLSNQHRGDYFILPKFNSEIGPFTSTSDALFSGKKYNCESSRDVTTDSLNGSHQQKPTYEVLPSYSSALRNRAKDAEADWEANEVVLSAWEWSSRGFVRDYNHKSINVSDQRNAGRDSSEKCLPRFKVKMISASEEKVTKESSSMPSASSTLSKKSSRLDPSFSGYPERSGINFERLSLPKKMTHLSSMRDRFDSELEKTVKGETNTKIGLEVDYQVSYDNIRSETPGQNKNSHNSQSSKTLLQKMLKQKSHDSKGGITKINRRVQKQVRSAAPKLIHWSSESIKNILESSPQQKDQSSKTGHTIKLIKEEEEEMDWEPIEPEKVVKQVEALRKEGGFQNAVNPELVNLCNMDIDIAVVTSQWFVVLDTNVLLSHLTFVRGLRDMKDAELGMPTLFIPWVVLQELDHLKSTQKKVSLQSYARRAINFIYENLVNKHPRVGGQPKAEADEYDALEPDDSILQCSINLQKYSSKVLLLTNDRNLFNKAVVNGVECCSAPKLTQELESRRKLSSPSTSSCSILDDTKLPFHSTVQTIKQCVGVVLEELLRTEMVLVYDRKWSEIVVRKPPWTLNDILFCLLKHWVAVFRLVLPSAARELIEKIRTFVNNEVYETTLESVESLVKTSTALMHLVSSLSYKQYVDNALKTLNELQSSLKKEHTKLSLSTQAKSPFVHMDKVDSNLSNVSPSTIQLDDSDAASVLSKGEQLARSTGSGIDSRENGGSSSITDSKIDTDDCLSLFASSFSDDIGNNQLSDGCIERGQELTHKYLNKIWEKIAIYCGMLCDVMGVEPCVPYQPPEPFPAVETLHQNMLFFVKCVSTLLRCMEGILFCPPSELQENSPILLNFYNTIKESLSTWSELGEVLLPQHVLMYCSQTNSRQQLEHGKKQFEQFEAVLNQAVTFFMRQNQSVTSLPLF